LPLTRCLKGTTKPWTLGGSWEGTLRKCKPSGEVIAEIRVERLYKSGAEEATEATEATEETTEATEAVEEGEEGESVYRMRTLCPYTRHDGAIEEEVLISEKMNGTVSLEGDFVGFGKRYGWMLEMEVMLTSSCIY